MSRIRTMNFDAIAAAVPLDRQASTIRDGSGDLWEAKVDERIKHWTAPPLPEAERPANVPDLTGRKIDRLTVIRYHATRPSGGHFWLVRCACGDYELRRNRFIEAPPARTEDQEHACAACDRLAHLRWLERTASRTPSARRRADEALLDSLAKGRST